MGFKSKEKKTSSKREAVKADEKVERANVKAERAKNKQKEIDELQKKAIKDFIEKLNLCNTVEEISDLADNQGPFLWTLSSNDVLSDFCAKLMDVPSSDKITVYAAMVGNISRIRPELSTLLLCVICDTFIPNLIDHILKGNANLKPKLLLLLYYVCDLLKLSLISYERVQSMYELEVTKVADLQTEEVYNIFVEMKKKADADAEVERLRKEKADADAAEDRLAKVEAARKARITRQLEDEIVGLKEHTRFEIDTAEALEKRGIEIAMMKAKYEMEAKEDNVVRKTIEWKTETEKKIHALNDYDYDKLLEHELSLEDKRRKNLMTELSKLQEDEYNIWSTDVQN